MDDKSKRKNSELLNQSLDLKSSLAKINELENVINTKDKVIVELKSQLVSQKEDFDKDERIAELKAKLETPIFKSLTPDLDLPTRTETKGVLDSIQ